MTNQEFFISFDGKQEGPFTISELKLKSIRKETLIWTKNLDEWTKAEYIPLLNDILKATPPPIPEVKKNIVTDEIPPIPSSNIENTKYFGYKLSRRRDRLLATIIEAIIIFIPLMLIYLIVFDENYFENDFNYFSMQSFNETFIYAIITSILGAIFYPIWSSNLGHKIMGLKVISVIDGKDKNNAADGILREGIKAILSFLIIPSIWLLWDADRQNLYDKIAKTYVVKK